MIRVESFLCVLVAVAVGASEGFEDPFSVRVGEDFEFQDIIGEPFPNDTVYERISVSDNLLYLSIVNEIRTSATTVENCRILATQKGGHVFWHYGTVCWVATLQFPLCSTQGGDEDIYIQPKYLTTGTSNDGTTVEPLIKGARFSSVVSYTNYEYGSFRVDSPTITSFFQSTAVSSKSQTIFLEDPDQKRYVNADIVVSPACYSNSSCGTTFIYPIPAVKRTIKVFSDYCGKSLNVRQGEDVYLVSHDEFGCSLFPDNGYGGSECIINYGGFIKPLKITIQYFNFVGDDACDGFDLRATAFFDEVNWCLYKLCEKPYKEIIAENPRGRLHLKGISATQRPKLGFIIKFSYT